MLPFDVLLIRNIEFDSLLNAILTSRTPAEILLSKKKKASKLHLMQNYILRLDTAVFRQ